MEQKSSIEQRESKLQHWGGMVELWTRLTEPSASIQDGDQRRLSKMLAAILLIVLPLIILVGLVVMPIAERAPNVWQSATFLPALLASVVSILAYGLNRSGRYRIAAGIYILIFVISPWWAVVRTSSVTIFPLAILTVGGVLMASLLLPDRFILLVSAILPVVGVFLLPWMVPGVSFPDIASTLSVIVTINTIILILTYYRGQLERERHIELQSTNIDLRESASYSEERLTQLIDTIVSLSTLDFNVRASVGENGDMFDAIATGLNALGEELVSTYISRTELEETVKMRTSELEAANTELTNFAYVVSHDLKAPLRAISQLSSWVVEDYSNVVDEEGRRKLNMLVDRTKHMHNLIEGILQYSRVGRITEKIVNVDLNTRVREIIDLLDPPKTIHIAIEDKLPVVTGELTYITQVFQNLLSNAIRYIDRPDGIITVKCKSEKDDWVFSVADNGPGIEEKYFDKIFQMFQTLGTRKDEDSTGIGLALVKRIIEKWGGNIWVESRIGRGSTFFFTMPKNGSSS